MGGCPTTPFLPPVPPPTPPPPPLPTPPPSTTLPTPAPPPNCAVDPENTWDAAKREYCCRVHHRGCPSTPAPLPPVIVTPAPPGPVDPYNCDAGFANWKAGWSVAKKAWCCSNEGKGCPPA